jgi:hypothetical protein
MFCLSVATYAGAERYDDVSINKDSLGVNLLSNRVLSFTVSRGMITAKKGSSYSESPEMRFPLNDQLKAYFTFGTSDIEDIDVKKKGEAYRAIIGIDISL